MRHEHVSVLEWLCQIDLSEFGKLFVPLLSPLKDTLDGVPVPRTQWESNLPQRVLEWHDLVGALGRILSADTVAERAAATSAAERILRIGDPICGATRYPFIQRRALMEGLHDLSSNEAAFSASFPALLGVNGATQAFLTPSEDGQMAIHVLASRGLAHALWQLCAAASTPGDVAGPVALLCTPDCRGLNIFHYFAASAGEQSGSRFVEDLRALFSGGGGDMDKALARLVTAEAPSSYPSSWEPGPFRQRYIPAGTTPLHIAAAAAPTGIERLEALARVEGAAALLQRIFIGELAPWPTESAEWLRNWVEERQLAIMMAAQVRLGRGSILGWLDPGLVKAIALAAVS